MITWITDNVAIGEYTDAINEELLKKEKIECVFSLRFEELRIDPDWYDSMGIDFYRVPVGYYPLVESVKIELGTAVYMLEQLTKKYDRILVHCTAGIDRAPFVIARYLTKKDIAYNVGEAYGIIKQKRPQIIEHYEWV